MAGTGAPGGIRIDEPGERHRDESSAAAAAAAPPPPAPPSDGRQELPHGPPGAAGGSGSGSPSAADAAAAAAPPPPAPPSDGRQELPQGSSGAAGGSGSGSGSGSPSAAAAAAAARKGKGVLLAPSPPSSSTSSEDTSSPPSPDIVSEKEESSSADTLAEGGRKSKVVTWKKQLVEATVEVPKVTRPLDVKSPFDNLTPEQQWALAEDMELLQLRQLRQRQQRQQARQKKSIWSKIKGDMANLVLEMIGRQMYNSNPVIMPHVNHQTIPTTRIIEHYNLVEMSAKRGVIFHSNELNLRRAYSEFRPVLGDGECFYRSFIFSYLEQVLDRQDTNEEQRLLAAVKGVAGHHACLGWTSEFPQRYKAFKTLIKKVMRWKRDKKFVPTTDSYRKQKLLNFFSGYVRTDDIFAFLRLVAAIWICSHSEEFQPRIPEANEYDSLRDWCFHEVIKHKVFTDHVHITALATALGVPLRVEYLLAGDGQDIYTHQEEPQDNMPRSTCWPGHHRQLPHAHVAPHVTVLYSNLHYDIIYPHRRDGPVPSIDESSSQQTAQVQRPTAKSSGQQIAQRDSCSGKSSSQHIAQVETSTGENPDQQAELKSTSAGAHEYDEHKSIAE